VREQGAQHALTRGRNLIEPRARGMADGVDDGGAAPTTPTSATPLAPKGPPAQPLKNTSASTWKPTTKRGNEGLFICCAERITSPVAWGYGKPSTPIR
jgi:hypothetical protein